MPELPEVETVVRGLRQHLVRRVIEWVHLSRGDVTHGVGLPLCALLRGRRIERIERVGKQIRMDVEGSVSLFVHLGMTGRLLVADRDEEMEPHTHLRLTFRRRRQELRYCDPRRFGGIWLISGAEGDGRLWVGRRLPPAGADPLEVSLGEFRSLLARARQIKALLLDQRVLGGVGNIYCDEALYRAGIHPRTPAGELDEAAVRRLRQVLRQVLAESIRAGGSSISDYRTADNVPGTFQRKHRVYGREGKPCRRCRTVIRRIIAAGRSSFLCPQCQPARRPRARRTRRG